jgi:hypothetical protein
MMGYMADVPKPKKLTHKEQVEQDAMAFAELLYDIYQDKKRRERENELSQSIREIPKRIQGDVRQKRN